MATGEKSSSSHPILNHVEVGTDPTGEGKNSESSFSKTVEEVREDGSIKTNTTNPTTTMATTPASSLQTATTLSPVQDNQSETDEVSDLATQESSAVSTPAPKPTTGPPVTDVDTQRKSDAEVDTADTEVTRTPAHSSDSSRMQGTSIDDAPHLMEILSSPEGNSQIVERSPGERYVRFSEKLGSGASKDVYRAYDTEEGIEVAWNVVHLAGVPKSERNRIVNEVRLLERLHHQNIISFHGSWINREQQQVNFVTEILSSGTLKSFINKVQVIRWKIAKRWAVQILKGLEYLHAQEPPVIHRDLKCENIFINGTSGDLRIGDLGLSTVHRNNGKALSVLGTPEFMAPDMYEEGSYDEKVDIYAFGMCLLEIFTKEIPYSECTNPAQIYKKVTRGAPPDSLSRLKSAHARKFIELCLGYKNEEGKYVRPSAKELLEHEFLEKRQNDDEEVEVDLPLQEQAIVETGTRSLKSNTSASTTHSQNPSSPAKEVPTTTREVVHQNSLDEDESDRFSEMPESEVNNMKKVKVMMGRGEELKEEDEIVEDVNHVTKRNSADLNTSIEVGSLSSQQQNVQPNNDTNYLVAAAVIAENDQSNSQPYPDDILQLVITLPVEGQTQNVQFNFHLVEDDPIQVAKEMVAELGIPEEAVLEISETVSGLARVARTKKHKFNSAKAQQNATHIRTISGLTTDSQVGQTVVAQQQTQQHVSQGLVAPTNQQQPIPDYIPSQQAQLQQPAAQSIKQPLPQQSLPVQDQSMNMHGQHLQQRGSMTSNDPEPHLQPQIPFVQAGIKRSSQVEAPSHTHQRDHSQLNGEYHHQGHVSTEAKQPMAPYGQAPVPPPAPPIPQQRTPQPTHGTVDASLNGSAGNYAQPAPSPIQQGVQYTPNRVAQPPAHIPQPGGSAQQTIAAPLPPPQPLPNQQIHGSSQGLSQYSPHQQLQPAMQRAHSFTQPQQQLVPPPVPQIPNIPPQHMPNVVQQPPPVQLQMNHQPPLPQQQQLQQPITTQQHQIHQQQQTMAPQHAGNQVQPDGQRMSTGASSISLPMAQDIPQSADYAPVAQQNQTSHLIMKEGIVSSTIDPTTTKVRSRTTSLEKEQESNLQGEAMEALEGLSIVTSGEDEPTDEVRAAELRKLDEDYQNNLKRAKKVFDSRMDNLQRTQVQREAQHQKTLEQHQKDRTAFEKRLRQEEIEQNRRIELLQEEWDRKREEVRLRDNSPNQSPDGSS